MLSDEQIARIARSVLEAPVSDGEVPAWSLAVGIARAIEAEVRKQDTELIRQMLEALNTCDESDGYTGLRQFFDEKAVESAITAARARLENT